MSNEDERSLEQEAFEDLDVIYGLADAGLVSVQIDQIDNVEEVLMEIKDIAEQWSEPESDAFENYEGTHV